VGCTGLDAAAFGFLSYGCPQLELLDVSACPGFTDKAAGSLCGLGELKRLTAEDCTAVTEEGTRVRHISVLRSARLKEDKMLATRMRIRSEPETK
jgi:hypothetical protein